MRIPYLDPCRKIIIVTMIARTNRSVCKVVSDKMKSVDWYSMQLCLAMLNKVQWSTKVCGEEADCAGVSSLARWKQPI